MNKKISFAQKKGEIIDYDLLFNKYPEKRKKLIRKKARYIKAAIELRKLREKLNLSQQALAKKMKVEREYISRLESGRQNITLETLYRIAEATSKDFTFRFQ